MGKKLTLHQHEVFKSITNNIKDNLVSFYKTDDIENYLLSLTGAAGTGKSFLTAQIAKEILKYIEEKNHYVNDKIFVTAPTHKAVNVIKNIMKDFEIDVESSTIHSFLNLKALYDYDTGEEKYVIDRHNQSPQRASLLIIDESSMISSKLYEFIIETITTGRVNTVLFIGDPFQLLPVNEKSNNVFLLRKQFELKEVVRQAKNSPIITLATKIRNQISNESYTDLRTIFNESRGIKDIEFFKSKNEFLKSFYFDENWYREDKILTSFTNDDVESFNKIIRDQLWQEQGIPEPKAFLSGDVIRFKKPFYESRLRGTTHVIFQNSEEVIINKAELIYDEKHKFSYWKCSVDENKFFRVMDKDSLLRFNTELDSYINRAKTEKFPYNRTCWRKYFALRDAFADVQYTFAGTIHKLQGSTYNRVYIDLSSILNNSQISNNLLFRLVYVAITRAKNSVKILL